MHDDFDLCGSCGAWRSAHKAGLQDPKTAHDFVEKAPKVPDLDKIARKLLQDLPFEDGPTEAEIEIVLPVLRQVWNARGAADIAKTEAYVWGLVPEADHIAKPAVITELERALRSLDR